MTATAVRKPRVLLAKEVKPSEDIPDTQSDVKLVPLSLAVGHKGPKRDKHGNILSFSVLGDPDDYLLFSGEAKPQKPAPSVSTTSRRASKLPGIHNVSKSISGEAATRLKPPSHTLPTFQEEPETCPKRSSKFSATQVMESFKDLKQEKKFENWRRHQAEWAKVERAMSKKLHKDQHELLLSRLSKARPAKEAPMDLLEEAIEYLEKRNLDFWKCGLRIGNDLMGLIAPVPLSGPRHLESVLPQAEEIVKKGLHKKKTTQRDRSPSAVSDNVDELFLLSKEENAEDTIKEQLFDDIFARASLSETNNDEAEKALETASIRKLICSTERLSFEVQPGEISTSIITLYNRTRFAIDFTFRKIENNGNLPVKVARDSTQRFFFHHQKGTILPGHAFDIPITFTSTAPGIFSEKWVIETKPDIKTLDADAQDISIITFQAIVIQEDVNEVQRSFIRNMVNHQEALTMAKKVLDDIIEIVPYHRGAIKNQTAEPLEILRGKNLRYQLEFSRRLLKRLTNFFDTHLKSATTEEWDLAIDTLFELIADIEDGEKRSTVYKELNGLLQEFILKSHYKDGQRLHAIIYNVLVQMSDAVPALSENLRRQYGLPLNRSCVHKFSESENGYEEEDKGLKPQTAAASAPVEQVADKSGKKTQNIAPTPAPSRKAPSVASTTTAPSAPTNNNANNANNNLTNNKGKPNKKDEPIAANQVVERRNINSSKTWSKERKLLEAVYRKDLHGQVFKKVCEGIGRMEELIDADGISLS